MTIDELQERQRIIEIALTWMGTPYHHQAAVRGAGCDCITFIAEVFEEAGIVTDIKLPPYAMQWHLHHSEELYLDHIKKYCGQVYEPIPADIVLYRFGRTASHGAIYIAEGKIIHSAMGQGVTFENSDGMKARLHGYFRPKRWCS
jgi:cell wall-associated NlpC family hydrolase